MKERIIMMGLITTIFNLFGCSEQTKKNEGKLSKAEKDQIAQSIDLFENRPMYIELTEQVIDTIADDNLLQAVFENLSAKQPDNYEKEFEIVMSWNKSRQAIYMIWILEGEVNNGGYNQFYFNSSGQFYKYLPDALRLVGAPKFADLTERANNVYEKKMIR